jgi:Fe-S cluster biogenesis protein NfuA
LNNNTAELSQRVQSLALSPKHLVNDDIKKEIEADKNSFHCEYEFVNSNGSIELFGIFGEDRTHRPIKTIKYITNVKGPALGVIDAIVELCHKRNAQALSAFTMREVESYLRDRNDSESLPNAGASFYRYFQMIPYLQSKIFKSSAPVIVTNKEKKSPQLSDYVTKSVFFFDPDKVGPFKTWSKDFQYQVIASIFSVHVSPFLQKDGGDVECVHLMDNIVVINFLGNCGTCGMSLTSTLDFIKKVLRAELDDQSIDVLSDS